MKVISPRAAQRGTLHRIADVSAERATDHASYLAQRSFASLDGLRAPCIVAVIYHHAAGTLSLGVLGTRGFLGVDMFFVLSGFLIVTLLLRERARNGEISLKSFYARRTLRIMPLHYGILLALGLYLGTVARHGVLAASFFAELPFYLTLTTNWISAKSMLAITWSLSAEEQFYLFWPAIERATKRVFPVLFTLLLLSQLIQFHVFDGLLTTWLGRGPGEVQSTLYMLYQTTFTPILLGVLLAHLLHDKRSFDVIAPLVRSRYACLVYCALLLVCLLYMPGDLSGAPHATVHLIMMLLLASIVASTDHALAPLLNTRVLRRIGVLSYGMYLLHLFALHGVETLLHKTHGSQLLVFPLTLGLSLIAAEISYRYYETPFLRLKSRFAC